MPPRRCAIPERAADRWALAVAALGGLALAGERLAAAGPAAAGLVVAALALGGVLAGSGFSFAGGFRSLLRHGDGAMLAAGLLLPAVAALAVVPVIASSPAHFGAIAPVGLAVAVGAGLFGTGMQLANGCGSGTLYAAGQGSARMWIVLPFFCTGGVLGSLALPLALAWPALPPVALGDALGTGPGLLATEALLGLMAVALLRRGPRPPRRMLLAGTALGVLAAAVFLLSGQPWSVTMGLTLAGAKAATALGLDLTGAAFWQWDGNRAALAAPLLDNASALTDLGIVLGAAAAAGWRGRFGTGWPGAGPALAAALGGLAMGVGARRSFGCNVGAFAGGAASGSLHGFLWFAAALPGSWLGVRLRPVFGLGQG